MPSETILLLDPQHTLTPQFEEAAFRPRGHRVLACDSLAEAIGLVKQFPTSLGVVAMPATPEFTQEAIATLRAAQPRLPVLVLLDSDSPELVQAARQAKANDLLVNPRPAEVDAALERLAAEYAHRPKPGTGELRPRLASLPLTRLSQHVSRLMAQEAALTGLVREAQTALTTPPGPSAPPADVPAADASPRVRELETLAGLAQGILRHLNLDAVLTAIVEAAVALTGADEGSLMLLDEASGDLYMRAAKNFDEQFVRTFRARVQDSLAGEALRSGEPVLIDEHSPQKITTTFLVHSLIFVPLKGETGSVGLLGVDNRQAGRPLNAHHVALMQALGEYAAVALENARLYSQVQSERRQLETILQQTEDGVLITDPQDRLLLINRTAQEAFGLNQDAALLHPLTEAVPHPELLALYARRDTPSPQLRRAEVTLADGRVFHTHLTPIEGVGHVVVMRDITHLKELDRIKSEFVTTVSHDLRSPLTTILGYVDLIERGGPLTPQQHEFLRRVQDSTQSITALITDLVHLGRIEAGLDTQQDLVDLSALAGYAADSLRLRSENKGIHLEVDLPPDLPAVAGNPVRLRQMINNLIDNAIKFTPENGRVTVSTHLEENQVLLLVSDTGVGIPTPEQPYIFNKFYRASNVEDGTGSGLGLSIVKSIVEVHGGRIWVESTVGEGSTFTVVLPTAQAKQDEPPEVSASGG
ncbi:MAG TPA: ATP-binding protein [Anaerolineales bacterium]|nr:ATP-binding protein [Anaerolineales bacterium]